MSNLILDTYTRINGEQREINTLREQVEKLKAENEDWRNNSYTSLWKLRAEDRDKTIEMQRQILLDLREQVAHLSLFKPAVRTSQHSQPVSRIGETNYGYFGVLIETDEDFAERDGRQVTEVA